MCQKLQNYFAIYLMTAPQSLSVIDRNSHKIWVVSSTYYEPCVTYYN